MNPEELVRSSWTGLAFDTEAEYEAAISALSDYLAARPDNAHAWNNRGVAYMELGHFEQSLHDLTRAVLVTSSDYIPLSNRAELRLKMGDAAGALADADAAIAINPNRPVLWIWRATANHLLGREDAADVDRAKAEALRDEAEELFQSLVPPGFGRTPGRRDV